jgi:ribosomal protein L20
MPRVKRGTKRRAKRKKILDRASGYYLTKSKLYRSAKESVERGLKFAYAGRRQKKRQFRSLWIAHQRRLQAERTELQPVYQRLEEGRHRVGPQDPL